MNQLRPGMVASARLLLRGPTDIQKADYRGEHIQVTPQLVLFTDLNEIERVDRRHALGLRLLQRALQLLGAGAA